MYDRKWKIGDKGGRSLDRSGGSNVRNEEEARNPERKNAKEMDALRVEVVAMKRKLKIERTPIVHEDNQNSEGSNAQTVKRMEGENSS